MALCLALRFVVLVRCTAALYPAAQMSPCAHR